MVDRQDIDALLVSALYGELTPADEARLAAHLESHPTDRTALADLTRARTAVRESRILDLQLDPPQSVSALLLQEAARRAPRKVDSEKRGWFQRLMLGLVAHPAMAAAAMLVVVVGVAGTMYARHGSDAFTDQTVASSQVAPSAPAPSLAAERRAQNMSPGGTDGYGVDLAKRADVPAPNEDQPARDEQEQSREGAKAETAIAQAPAQGSSAYGRSLGDDAKAAPAKVSASRPTTRATPPSSHGMIVNGSDKPAPRDFEDRDRSGVQAEPPPPTTTSSATPTTGAAQAGFPQSKADSNTRESVKGGVSRGAGAPASPPPAQPTAPAVDRSIDKASEKKDEERKATEDIVWAKNQLAQARALVKTQNCTQAARVVLAIQKRAPDYYNQYVATNIDLKPCRSYVENARESDESQKSRAKRPAPADMSHE